MMKMLVCYVQTYNLDVLAEALAVEGVRGMTVSEVKGFGTTQGFNRAADMLPGEYRFHPKMKVEMVIPDEDMERIVAAITRSLKGSKLGEGKIFVLPVEEAVRTRTGERGVAAITA